MRNIAIRNIKHEHLALFTLVGLLVITISKDLFDSSFNGYHFYLSDSLLFNSFWPLFIPFVWVLHRMVKRTTGYSMAICLSILCSILHIFIFSLLVFVLSGLFFDHTFAISRVFTDTVADNAPACLLIYGAITFVSLMENTKNGTRAKPGRIRVTQHNKIIVLDVANIMYVKTERPYIAMSTKNATYLHSLTLKKFLEMYSSETFVQIHKSTIVNTEFVSFSRSRKNGDLDVVMYNGDTVRASRNYAGCFTSVLLKPPGQPKDHSSQPV